MPLSFTLDHAGPLTRTVEDCALAMQALAGHDAEMLASVDAAADVLRGLGATVVDVTLPARPRFDASTQAILLSEGFAIHHEWLRTRPQDYGRVTRERLSMGAFVTGSEYVQAQRLRRILTAEVDAVLTGCDAILCAGITSAAPLVSDVDEGPFRRSHPITAAFNGTGHPALALPGGFGASGLPLGRQLVGRSFASDIVPHRPCL